MSDKFPNLNVNIKSKLGYLKLEGMSKEVAIAQKEALSMINSIISETMAINEIETKFFSEKEVCVCKWLKEKSLKFFLLAFNFINLYFKSILFLKTLKLYLKSELLKIHL